MVELLGESRRTHYSGEINENEIGRTVAVCGWCQRQRDLGGLIFIDLRDRAGVVQLAFDSQTKADVFGKAELVRGEYVLFAEGVVRERSSKNPNIPTGNVEIAVTSLKILAKSETPPFEITDDTSTSEDIRLKYRYLDLRRPVLTKNLKLRYEITKIIRDYFDKNGFIEIETPMLIKSTPEGARDYLVPSRIHKGSFYALPQSPQLYKQLSMVAGLDRYFQLARCFRDEDLRADRQPEFTQIDYEMSFADMEDVMKIAEGLMSRLFRELLGEELSLPLPRYTYEQVTDRFGSDKPDLRYGLEIVDITNSLKNTSFPPFSKALSCGGGIKCINAKGGEKLTRKSLDALSEYAKGCGAAGAFYLKMSGGEVSGPLAKHLTSDEISSVSRAANLEDGDALIILAEENKALLGSVLGLLRTKLASSLGIKKEGHSLFWVVEMPFFELDPESGEWAAMHHPFTSPLESTACYLKTDKSKVKAKAYDLVYNGIELSSGSVRITDPVLQEEIFALLGLSEEESRQKFGYLTLAFKYGVPPHGGMGLGLDRLVMQLAGAKSLRDVTAFPKVQNASELMTDCPSEVPGTLLGDLGITLKGD